MSTLVSNEGTQGTPARKRSDTHRSRTSSAVSAESGTPARLRLRTESNFEMLASPYLPEQQHRSRLRTESNFGMPASPYISSQWPEAFPGGPLAIPPYGMGIEGFPYGLPRGDHMFNPAHLLYPMMPPPMYPGQLGQAGYPGSTPSAIPGSVPVPAPGFAPELAAANFSVWPPPLEQAHPHPKNKRQQASQAKAAAKAQAQAAAAAAKPSDSRGAQHSAAAKPKAEAQGKGRAPVLATAGSEVPESSKTTVMIRNLPDGFSRDALLELLDSQGFSGRFDFAYLPVGFDDLLPLKHAFVNLLTPKDAIAAREHFDGFTGWAKPSDNVCAVAWNDKQQGLASLIERYRNSPVMHDSVPDECKPILVTKGKREPFPTPTQRIKAPKILKGKSA